ncbi:MAG: hypothetical protein M4D80_20510 [Myxococcota bacterium]|nr:hypothetical protein [Myxococcota bacterium]
MYSDEPPWDAADTDAPVVETGVVRIVPPRAKVTVNRDGALVVARVPNGWRIPAVPTIAAPRQGRAVTIAAPRQGRAVTIAAPRQGRAVTIDGDTVIIPPGETIEQHEIASRASRAGVLVFIDGKASFDELTELAFALRGECWAIAIAEVERAVVGGAFGGGEPCPSTTPEGNFLRLRYPAKSPKTRFKITLTFAAS